MRRSNERDREKKKKKKPCVHMIEMDFAMKFFFSIRYWQRSDKIIKSIVEFIIKFRKIYYYRRRRRRHQHQYDDHPFKKTKL